jgi:hypothetical protein
VKTGEVAIACPLCDLEARGGSEEDRKLVADKIKSEDQKMEHMDTNQPSKSPAGFVCQNVFRGTKASINIPRRPCQNL